MTPVSIGIMGIVALIVLLMFRIPVGISMVTVAAGGNILLMGFTPAMAKFGIDVITITQNYSLSVIPLFVLMGVFLTQANLGADLFEVINHFGGRRKGSLAVVTIGVSAIFSTVCGSVVAAVSTMASVAVPEMRKYKYEEGFAAGVTAIGSTLAVIIPPSTALVIYGVLTEESIGQVLIGGLVPGIMTMLLLMLTVPIVLKFRPHLAPEKRVEKFPFPWKKAKYIWVIPVIFIICIGGIYGGFFTPTEAGSIGAFASLIFAIAIRRMNWKSFVNSLKLTVRISSMTFLILIGGSMFGAFLTRARIPLQLVTFIQGLSVSPFLIVLVILLIYTAMGPVMDEMATLVIMTPIIYPIIISLGYNGVWFGVMSNMMLMSGLLTPPVGVISLVAASVTKIPAKKVFFSQWPFWITLLIACVLIAVFPQIALFLPQLMYGK